MADKIYSFRIDIEDRGKVAEEILKVDQSLQKLNETRRQAKKDLDKGKISQDQYNKVLKDTKLRETELRQGKIQLAKADRSLATQTISTKNSMAALRAETSLLIQKANQLNLATAQGRKEFASIQKQVDKNKTAIRNFDRQMSGSKTLVGEYGRGIVSSFKSMAAGLIGFTALIRVMRDLTKVTGEFDTATAKLASVTLSTREEISELTDQAERLGATTIFTAAQVTDLQISLAKLGFTAEEIQQSTAAVVDFATATGADLGQAAKVAGVAIRAFGLDALEAEATVASLAIGTTKSALAFEDYETILSTTGSVARAYGFTLEDTIALTGRLRDAGFDASKAATATRNILLNLADANGALAQKLGGSVGTLDEMIDALVDLDERGIGLNETLELTDKRSVAAFSQFLQGAESVRELKDQVTDTTDQLEEMVDLQLDSFAGDVKALQSAWQGFILSLQASGALREVTQFLKDAVLQVSNLDLAFTKFHKQTGQQIEESFNLLSSLSNKQGQEFQAVIAELDKIDFAKLSLDPEDYAAQFAEIRNVNKKESVALAKEYIRQRHETNREDIEINLATERRKAEDAVDIVKRREADKEKAAAEAREKQAKADLKAAEKLAKEKAAAEKKATEEAAREIARFKIEVEREVAKALERSTGGVLKQEETIADQRIDLLKQQLDAVKLLTADSEEERIAQLEKTLVLEGEIRRAEFAKDQVARDLLLEQAKSDYNDLETTLRGLKDRLASGEITKEFFNSQQEIIEASQENIMQTQEILNEQTKLANEELENDLTAQKVKGAQERAGIEKKTQKEILDEVDKGLQVASKLTTQFSDLFEAQKQKELSAAGDNAAKREEIEKKYARRQQAVSVTQALINVAQGITKAIAQGGILGIITGGIVSAAGLLQVQSIRAAKFEEGGKVQSGSELPGFSKSGDNTLALVKPGEAVLNQRQQLAIGGPEILRRAGVPGFATGGVVGAPEPNVSGLNGGLDLVGLINSIKVVQNVNELHDAERELEVINETSEI